MATINISKLQRLNDVKITRIITGLDLNTAAARGEDLDSDSVIEDILYNWAGDAVTAIQKSVIEKGFNEAGTLSKFEPTVIDRAGVLKALQITAPDHWRWAEGGRKAGKRPPIAPIERWITYRGINVRDVQRWTSKVKDKSGKVHSITPYKNITNTLKLRNIMAFAISRSIGKKGTIKRFGYKGSNFLSEVINVKALQNLSIQISKAVGYNVAVSIVKTI